MGEDTSQHRATRTWRYYALLLGGTVVVLVILGLGFKCWRALAMPISTTYAVKTLPPPPMVISNGLNFTVEFKHGTRHVDARTFIETNHMAADIRSIRWRLEFESIKGRKVNWITISETDRVLVSIEEDEGEEDVLLFRKEGTKWDMQNMR